MIDRLIHDAAREVPSSEFVAGSGGSFTYQGAAQIIDRVAAQLQRRGVTRLAFHVQDSPRLILLLCACAAAGVDACALDRSWPANDVAETLRRFELPILVADSDLSIDGAQVIRIDQFFSGAENAQPTPPPSQSRLLILTSGTTGVPKGAWYTWDRLIAQSRPSPRWTGLRWLLAYHLNHFAALHMLAHVIANRGCIVVPASGSVTDAVAALEEQRVQCISATPTFWRQLLAQLERDRARSLPVRQVTLGGEAVPSGLIERLQDYFPHARISQVFATTESGSCLSVRDGREGLPASLLEEGQVRIVEGELHVPAAHGMLGYFGDAPVENGWWPTGDLVELRGDRIHFVGRKSEVINVGGVKVHPLPVEQVVQSVPGVTAAHCYGRANPVSGQIVSVDVVPAPGVDRAALETAIHQAVASLPRHAQPRLVRFVEQLETVNRKVLRRS
jgi:acyl-CoA synthetase (AMP-forming)/AMP-acid ligase II